MASRLFPSPSGGPCGVVDLWQLALADANLRDTEDVELFTFDEPRPRGAPPAWAVEPGQHPWDLSDTQYSYGPDDLDRVERTGDKWQILVFTSEHPWPLLAMLRHELEHVLQHRQNPFLLHTAGALAHSLADWLGKGSNPFLALYATIATERAASAAGRDLALRTFGAPPAEFRGGTHDTLMFDDTPAPAPVELPTRMLGALALMPGFVARAAIGRMFDASVTEPQAVFTFADHLAEGTGPALCDALCKDPRLSQLQKELALRAHEAMLADPAEARGLLGTILPRSEELALAAWLEDVVEDLA